MTIARVSSRGRVTIPLEVRQQLAIGAGSRINFLLTANGTCVMEPVGMSLRSLEGVFHQARRKPVPLDDLESAIAAEAGEQTSMA
jgi:antitoxin PrlF